MRFSVVRAIMAILLMCPVMLTDCKDENGVARPGPRDTSFSAEAEFSFEIDSSNYTSFDIRGPAGTVDITGVQGENRIEVSGVRRVESDSVEDAEQHLADLQVEQSKTGTDILVEAEKPQDADGRNYIVNYTVTMPKTLTAKIINGAGEVTVDGMQAAVTIVNGAGDVIVQALQGALTITNGAGSVSVDDVLGSVSIGQGTGPVEASVTLPPNGDIEINTGNGNVDLMIPQSTSANLTAIVGMGSINVSDIALMNPVQEANSLSGNFGKGGGLIYLSTAVGNITITGIGGVDETVRSPLDRYRIWQGFGRRNAGFDNRYHCAEDLYGAPGTPVYAIADGVISYSGPMSGYGWLITIDHPQHDVYSLYGHLSTRRSKIANGEVRKGDVIAYLADDDEDGSGGGYPDWGPHLHFAIRQGSKSDYPPGSEDDRWMAGYTYSHPTTLGWLDPTDFMTAHSE